MSVFYAMLSNQCHLTPIASFKSDIKQEKNHYIQAHYDQSLYSKVACNLIIDTDTIAFAVLGKKQ